ncbi:hypothetical protein FCH31_19230 [Lelliottia amnigena]|uniref:hypothetical protein n=1 Tax=Lelliottia amnigena TaxID=61646 RepID=UPI001576D16B|nr:hypothetical protein [Lelliottia amnigena]NTX71538.1 hypothetical protein [Lelliottia amnigena]
MEPKLQNLITSLGALRDAIIEVKSGEELLLDKYGISMPAIYPADIEDMPDLVIKKLTAIKDINFTDDEIKEFGYLNNKVKRVQTQLIPHLYSSYDQAIPSFILSFAYINQYIDSISTFERLDAAHLIPRTLSKKIKSIEAKINNIEPGVEGIESKIKIIEDAHTAAENIPIDLDELKEYNKEAASLKQKIEKVFFALDNNEKEAKEALEQMRSKGNTADYYLAMCEEAIRASTSKGLAGAFEIKAEKLNKSITHWVGGLLIALLGGCYIGFERLKVLSAVLNQTNPSTAVIVTQLILSMFSIGAPLWLAWISTKQINQRFKLAEDYAFKAAVAKAYEGYKNEAAKVSNGDFEKRLFDSALTRLEEAPLRLIDNEDHPTPWTEMLNSKSFQKFLDASLDNIEFVKGLISKKSVTSKTASNDDTIPANKEKADA